MRDVAAYLDRTPPMLDLVHTSMDAIFQHMLQHMLEKDESSAAVDEALHILFTQDSGRSESANNVVRVDTSQTLHLIYTLRITLATHP